MERYLFYVTCFLFLFVRATESYVCNADYCTNIQCDTTSSCFKSNTSRIIKNGSPCKCCDLCIKQLPYNARCKTSTDDGIPSEECGDGLTCDPTSKRCVYRIESKCVCEQRQYDELRRGGALMVGTQRPKCNFLGYYDSTRCITGSTCFCVDEDGNRLFGTDFELKGKDMLCNCSKDAALLQKNFRNTGAFKYGDKDYDMPPPFAHCLPNGNYDPLQCVGENCFCLNKNLTMYGSITGITIKETMLCYNPAYHDESYFRDCEILRNDMISTIQNASDYNAEILGADPPLCSLDGFFAPVQCRGELCYCVYPDGRVIKDFNATRYSEAALEMNCYCAIDLKFVTDPVIRRQVRCKSNGNYEPIQCQGSLCYCVDKNGIQQGGEVHKTLIDTLDCSMANEKPPCTSTIPLIS